MLCSDEARHYAVAAFRSYPARVHEERDDCDLKGVVDAEALSRHASVVE